MICKSPLIKLSKAKDDNEAERFRNIILLPPFIASVILTVPTSTPQECAALIKAVVGNMKTELEVNNNFDKDKFYTVVRHILR